MATYYVSPYGSDANAGTGPGPSAAWQTLGKALGAAGIGSGDTVYVAPGTYRETVTVAMVSATSETRVLGDPQNAQGFTQTGGVLGVVPGPVTWTAYTTNDRTTPAAATLLTLSGQDYLTFEGLQMIGGNPASAISCFTASAVSTNITFRRCTFISGTTNSAGNVGSVTGAADTALNWLFDRCLFLCPFRGVSFTLPTSASADYSAEVVFRNCLALMGGSASLVRVTASGAGAFKGGGVTLRESTIVGGRALETGSASLSTTLPCAAYSNVVITTVGVVFSANTSGQIVEDYNLIWATSPRTNVSAGGNSVTGPTYAPLFDFGQALLFGFAVQPFGAPLANSPLLGFGTAAGATATDLLERPRPAGGEATTYAVGALERHNTAQQETSVVDAGGVGLKLVGPADHDILIPVDAAATSISIKVRYDTNHGTTNKPQVQLLANPEIGVSAQTVTATVGVDTWETLALASFTPTRKGWVTLRLLSRASAGSGIAYFDTLSVG